ncbi:MAG: carbohydrate ABC transporter permease [Pleurocapsa minor GSE-CHR-MK-17-07R]|jgi:multiple sugar transport system permease protein|nr:carbohydrate ABC transporter permease [Pleurocapsa minor GSE-CHR-MK 17-07R]
MLKRLTTSQSPFRPSPLRLFFSYIVLGFWSIVVLFPLYWLLVTAFKSPIDVSSGPKYIPWVDFTPSLYAWNEIVVSTGVTFVTRPYSNTLIVGLVSSLLALIIGTCAAYALTRFEYRPKPAVIGMFILCIIGGLIVMAAGVPPIIAIGSAVILFIVLANTIGKRFKGTMNNGDITFWLISQRMLPTVAVIIPIYVLYQQLSLLDTRTALIITYTTVSLPLVIWFMRDYIANIPLELEESAFIDGASRYLVLWRIILPLAVPGLIATFLIVLVFNWNEYVLALFLTRAESQTMPLLIAAQNATRGPQWWNISLLVLMMIAPLIFLAILLERYIAKGLLVGAVKG